MRIWTKLGEPITSIGEIIFLIYAFFTFALPTLWTEYLGYKTFHRTNEEKTTF